MPLCKSPRPAPRIGIGCSRSPGLRPFASQAPSRPPPSGPNPQRICGRALRIRAGCRSWLEFRPAGYAARVPPSSTQWNPPARFAADDGWCALDRLPPVPKSRKPAERLRQAGLDAIPEKMPVSAGKAHFCASGTVESGSEKVTGRSEKVASCSDKVVSGSEKVASRLEKTTSHREKTTSHREKTISRREKTTSRREKVASRSD
jgi:hypothetical protein